MRRIPPAVLRLLSVLAAGAALAGCGTAASTQTQSTSRPATARAVLTVSPSEGAPTTVFTVHFTVPDRMPARASGARRGFELGVTGPTRAGCLGARSVAAASAPAGQRVDVALDPARLGGRWCAGTYSARMLEVQTPNCAAGMMCPQFIRVVGTVGQVRFRVVGAA